MDFEINNITELYQRVRPALVSKEKELLRQKIDYVKKEDIWNYFINYKWKYEKGLTLYDIVDDILNGDNEKLIAFVHEKLKNTKQEVNLNEIEML